MTVDTEDKAIDFLIGMNAVFKRTGSRETCAPAPTDTDADFVVFAHGPHIVKRIAQAGFTNTSVPHADAYGGNHDRQAPEPGAKRPTHSAVPRRPVRKLERMAATQQTHGVLT